MQMPPHGKKSTLERFALPSLVSPASRSTPTPPIPTAFPLLQRKVVGMGGGWGATSHYRIRGPPYRLRVNSTAAARRTGLT